MNYFSGLISLGLFSKCWVTLSNLLKFTQKDTDILKFCVPSVTDKEYINLNAHISKNARLTKSG